MKLLNTLKTINKTLLNARDSFGSNSDKLDDLLDKEYIYNAAQKVKGVTGNIVQESGKLYQQAKDGISDVTKIGSLEDIKETIDKVTEEVKKSGTEILDKVTDKEAVYSAWEEAIEFSENVKDDIKKEGADLLEDIKKNILNKKEEEE